MRLLVSVRSPAEVEAAYAGGADIIDAKEPSRGSLGPVSPEVLIGIAERVPADVELSIALGDVTTPDAVIRAIASLPRSIAKKPTYLKLGFAGVSSTQTVSTLVRTAVAVLHDPGSLRIIAVAYGDAERVGSVAPAQVLGVAAAAGATGLLLDTWLKDGRDLFTWIDGSTLESLVRQAQSQGLLVAVAGGLTPEHLSLVSEARADILGVRGAACTGGREGTISSGLVRKLKQRLAEASSGFLQELRCVPTVRSSWRNA